MLMIIVFPLTKIDLSIVIGGAGFAIAFIGFIWSITHTSAAVTLLSGLAVLAGSVATSEAQRISDSIILKVLGARRTDIILSWLFEYALLGILTALVASVIGTGVSWALIVLFIESNFIFNLPLILSTAFIGAGFTTLLGLIGAMRSLSFRPAPFLRETV